MRLEYGQGLTEGSRDGGSFPVYGSAGIVGWHSTAITPDGPAIIVGRKGTAGSVHWSTGPCWPIDTTYFVHPTESILPRFAYFLLQSLDLPSLCAQTGVPGLNRDRVYGVRVTVPPLAEQRRIVSVLDQADATLAWADTATRRSVDLVQALREGSFERLWMSADLRPLGELVRRVRRPIEVFGNATYSEIGVRSHGRGIFHKEPVRGLDLGNKRVFGIEPGDLVLNIVFAWERAVAVASPEDAGRCGSHRFPTYRPRSGVDIDYVCHALLTNRGAGLLGLASPGSAGRNRTLSQESLLKSLIPLPSLAEQRRLVTLLAAAKDAARAHEHHRAAAAQLRTSLLADLLTGQHRIPHRYDLLSMVRHD